MDFSKIKGKIFFNNDFIASKKANIHILNHSLHFATAVFEGIRVYNSKALFIKDHIKRLYSSCKMMQLKINYSPQTLEKITEKLIKMNKLSNGYIRPIVFRSSHSMSPETENCKTLIGIACWEWGNLFDNNSGITINLSKYPRLNKKVYPIEAKSSGSYQTSVISRVESKKKNYDDCLMLDLEKNIAETTACNIFWIKKSTVFTPLEHSILNGVTRQAVLRICKKNNIKVKKGNYKLSHLINADSVFVTGTAAEIQPVKKILKKNYKNNSEILKKLKFEYEKLKIYCPKEVLKITS